MLHSNCMGRLFRIHNQAGASLKHNMHMLEAFNIEPWHGFILELLNAYPCPVPVTEVVTTLHKPKSTITKATNHLRDAGFITKKQNQKDGRSYLVQITPSGRAALQDFRQAYGHLENQLLKGISEKELAAFQKVLARMEDNLN